MWWQANIIIDNQGSAHLTEYGLYIFQSLPKFATATTPGAAGMSRWLAPEIINPPKHVTGRSESQEADVFAFGMVAVEVFTGNEPFGKLRNEAAILCISKGRIPKKPNDPLEAGFTDGQWSLIQECWKKNPLKRPTMDEVVSKWGGAGTSV
jgi:serine/threonine protein kinase